ncbi:hypothetical protein [Marinobacterium sp. BA1]|uniref:hypothetical protein n=1 Tax=Marinobacterium sp. BA1 TaxID=3138931 RepID=UPI0032E5F602
MFHARLCFEDGHEANVNLAARPLVGEFVVFENDRYRVKDVSHHAVQAGGVDEEPMVVIKVGIGRKGSHRHVLERSPRGFYTGSD